MAETRWQQLSQIERKTLLKKVFFDVLFNQPNLPAFMTDQDWSDLIQNTIIDFIFYRQPPNRQFSAVLDLEVFAYRYAREYLVRSNDQFAVLYDYLKKHLTNVKVNHLDLFFACHMENYIMWIDFNLEAVHLWMSSI